MFKQITMINYTRPLTQRLAARKVCGPYTWTPSAPNNGRGFYQDGKSLACGDSTFRLRLEYANEHLHESQLHRTEGYYCDEFQDSTLTPIIARLPHSRGFLAGWTMGENMCANVDGQIHETPEEAARAAHAMAESDAEKEREYRENEPEEDA